MKQKLRLALAMISIFISAQLFAQLGNAVIDYLSVPGPILLNSNAYGLAWSSHPAPSYYKQEYVPVKDKVVSFKKMVLIEVLMGDGKPIDLAQAKMAELKQLKITNPLVNYEVFQKNKEVLLDFLVSENTADGKTINILERNVYRYKAITDKSGKKGILLFGASERSYGKEADTFLVALKKNKSTLLNAVAAFSIPQVSVKK